MTDEEVQDVLDQREIDALSTPAENHAALRHGQRMLLDDISQRRARGEMSEALQTLTALYVASWGRE